MYKKDIKNLIFVLALATIFITVFYAALYFFNPGGSNDQNSPANSAGGSFSAGSALTQTNGDPNTGVEVTATYEKEKSQNQTMFEISFSTHVADYSDYNFKENIVLKDGQTNEYKADNLVKEGSGHHQSIEISFPSVSSPFKLLVKNLAGVPERIFNWKN